MRIILISILLIHFQLRGLCQESRLSESIISIAEELAADESDPEAVSLYIEKLYEIYENPVRINSAGNEEFSRLFFLSDFQAKVLADYINTTGKIVSLYEIANLPGFDKETAMMMKLFISFDETHRNTANNSAWRNTLLTNVIWKPDDVDPAWPGSPVKILSKYRFNAGSFSGGLTAEKDHGEELIAGHPPAPDFFSAHFAYDGKGIIRRIIIGDYSARFGQGTNINTTFGTGLSLHAPGYMAARSEIRPYTSTDENNFFRGAGVELSEANLALSLFFSHNSIDATLASSSGSSYDFVKSFYPSGLHNTALTRARKDAVTDIAYGANLSYSFERIRIGATWSEDRLSLPVLPQTGDPEKIFGFAGKSNSVYSLYYNSLIDKFLLYGEFSANRSLEYASIQGLTFRPSARLSVNLLYRHYTEGYFSLHGRGPGSSSSNSAGKSILGNFLFEAARHLFISGGSEIREFPWLRYRASSPSYSKKREIRIRYIPVDKLLLEGAYYYRLSTVDCKTTSSIPWLQELITKSFSASCRYSIYENLTLGTRLYYKFAEHSSGRGMLLLQDMNYEFSKIPVTLWLRYCLFSTDDWDTRIYVYENDLLYSFNIPALYGRGSRNYMMAGWRISDKAQLRFKYAISSKLLPGNIRWHAEEFRFQVRLFI